MTDTERRLIAADEIRLTESASGVQIAGYAAVFNSESQEIESRFGRFREIILPGAFTQALKHERSIPLLIEHDGLALADTATGTMRLSEDSRGLTMAADLDPADPDVQRILPKLRRGTLRSMSFGFKVGEDRFEKRNGTVMRLVASVKRFFDASVVTSPAYLDTSVALRSFEAWQKEQATAPEDAAARETRRRRLLLSKR